MTRPGEDLHRAVLRSGSGVRSLELLGEVASVAAAGSLDRALACAVDQIRAFTGWSGGQAIRFSTEGREEVVPTRSGSGTDAAKHAGQETGGGFELPVRARGRIVATLRFTEADPSWLGDEARAFLDQVARVLGAAAEAESSRPSPERVEAVHRRNRLEDSQRRAHIGSWEWDLRAQRLTWSEELFRIYGLGPGEEEPTFEGYLARVDPRDRDLVRRTVQAALEERGHFELEERIVRPDGAIRVLRTQGEVHTDGAGRAVVMSGTCQDVTELRRAARQAEEVRRWLQLIVDSVSEGILGLDEDGHISFVNRAAARMLGWSPRDLMGLPHHETLHARRADGSEHVLDECPIQATLRRGESHSVDEDVFWHADGSSVPVSFTSAPIRQDGDLLGAVVTFRDQRERQQTEEEARRALYDLVSEQAARAEAESTLSRLDRIFEQVPALVALLRGPEHTFELANPRFLELIGNRPVLGEPLSSALPEVADQPFAKLLDQVWRTGEPYVASELPALMQRSGASPVEGSYYNVVYQPLTDGAGRVESVLVHAVDVTEQVVARRDLERKASELARLTRELERSNRELDEFAYVASHDLKAPLRGISNLASWLEEDLKDRLDESTREYLELLKGRVARLEDFINGLLEFSRVGRRRETSQPVDTCALVRQVIGLLEPPESIEVVVAEDLPTLQAEPLRLQQVFQNLIGNALEHARSRIETGARRLEAGYEFFVSDDGPGIPPEYHERIWGIFQRLEARDDVEGTGIGLALVKKIVEDNGGRAWVESTPGEGATFRFTWPGRGARPDS